MEAILKEWLRRLNIETRLDTNVENKIKNGFIVASILYNYNVIDVEKSRLIIESNENNHLKSNWGLLRQWLQDIEITISDEDVESIKNGSQSIALRLFYQLFIFLDKKDRSDFLKQEKKLVSTLVQKPANRFKIAAANLEENIISQDNLSKPLLDDKLFIDWQRKKADEIKEMYEQARKKYLKIIEKSLEPVVEHIHRAPDLTKRDIEKFSLKYPTVYRNYTYKELIGLENKMKENPYIVDTEWTRNYMNNLLSRIDKKSDSEEFQKQMIQSITTTSWNNTIEKIESNHDAELANEVMKLSQFEKQICTQIIETKQLVCNLVKNRIAAEKEFVNEREHQFNIFIDSVKEDINSGILELDFENRRKQTLHKRLYAEKIKRKRKLYHEICYDTALSLVDYATKYGYYKRLMGDIPDKFIYEWKLMFFKKQPVFDIISPIDTIVIEGAENDIEEISDLSQEKKRQECLNESEFMEYIDYLDSWSLDVLLANYDPESEERKYERLGNNILAHVVYTLLELKYPLPPKRESANLPDYTTKSLVIDVPNTSIDLAMQKLLSKKNIFVLRVESCIDFCLRQYKTEMIGSVDISLEFEKLADNVKEENTKEIHKNFMSQRKLHSNKSEALPTTHDFNSKQTQTPQSIPEDNIVLSKAAYLGKQAFEMLSSGDSLPNDLITAMLAEHIKNQKEIKGFVILNYPNTYGEAQVLEETFSGKKPPNDIEYVLNDDSNEKASIEFERDKIEDPLKEYRKSKILKLDTKGFENKLTSYFTSYIKLKKSEKIDEEFFIWDLEQETSEAIDRFYSAVGANYSMYYEDIDKTQLALICRYVIGDFEFPIKTDEELFGPNVLDELEFPVENRKLKSKTSKLESSNSKSGKQNGDINTKSSLLLNANMMQGNFEHVPKDNLVESAVGRKSSRKSSTNIDNAHIITWKDAKETLAGGDNWEYSKINISERPGIELASCWEGMEKCYVNDVQQLLLSKRLQMHCLVPYTTFVNDKMKQIVMRPSPKQDLVLKFQQEYNNIEDDWRENIFTKNEWHCRVKELKNMLYDICDERKKYSEEEKKIIISENWICDELIVLANTYVSLMQTELNRFVLTYQILHDYYISLINKSLSQRLPLKELNKYERYFAEIPSTGKSRASEEKYRLLKEAFLDLQLRNIIIDGHNNPLNVFIDDNVKLALKYIHEMTESYKTLIGHETNDLISKFQNASSSSLRKKAEKDIRLVDSVEVQKFEYIKCMQEWKMGCTGESCRTNLRVTVLQKKCYEDMQIFCDQIFKAFHNIQAYIDDIYLNEIKSVDRLSKYLQMAIEMNRKISENLILDGDTFVIDFNVLQMPSAIKSEIPEEVIGEMEFKLCQLALLRDSFKIVAPTGMAIQQAFIYLLQDFVVFGKESCQCPTFPSAWRRIDPERIPEFVNSIFGENVFIDWRDFLIYCLNIPFPTTDELLDIRKKLRCQESKCKEHIDRDIFLKTPLWFENKLNDIDKRSTLRNAMLKHFLFELFEVSKNVMNYTALLLAFCKAKDPKEGFSNALALALGKKVCYLTGECDEAINNLIKVKKSKDKAYEDISNLLDLILYNVLDICAGTVIIELNDSDTKNVRRGKGKMSRRSKTSARISHIEINKPAVLSQPLRDKSEIKMIFMNPEKDKSDTGYNEEKDKKEKPNSDLIYSVSRDVIWKVLKICVPWQLKVFDQEKCTYTVVIDDVIAQMEKYNEDKSIYVSKFLAEPKICEFLHKIKKFSKPDINEEILKILDE